MTLIGSKRRFTVNGISFLHPDTPLKLVDNFKFKDVFLPGIIRDRPSTTPPSLGTSVIDAHYHDFYHIVFQNPLSELQTWHIDGYNFFVVG